MDTRARARRVVHEAGRAQVCTFVSFAVGLVPRPGHTPGERRGRALHQGEQLIPAGVRRRSSGGADDEHEARHRPAGTASSLTGGTETHHHRPFIASGITPMKSTPSSSFLSISLAAGNRASTTSSHVGHGMQPAARVSHGLS